MRHQHKYCSLIYFDVHLILRLSHLTDLYTNGFNQFSDYANLLTLSSQLRLVLFLLNYSIQQETQVCIFSQIKGRSLVNLFVSLYGV